MKHRVYAAIFAASAAAALSGCVTDDYGYGGGLSYGYGGGYYGGDPYWGWYDDYYYPGTGFYIYDRGGGRHRWNDRQRAYWEGRRGNHAGHSNWSGYRNGMNGSAGSQQWQQRRDAWRAQQQQMGQQQGGSATSQSWAQRREAWRAQHPSQGQTGAASGWQGRGGGNWNGRRHRGS